MSLALTLTLPGIVLDGEGAGDHRMFSTLRKNLGSSLKRQKGTQPSEACPAPSTSCRNYREEAWPVKVFSVNLFSMDNPAWHLEVEDGWVAGRPSCLGGKLVLASIRPCHLG